MRPPHPERARARALGLIRYSTGEPCPRGHLSERYTKCSKCIECILVRRSSPEGREIHNAASRRYNARQRYAARCAEIRESLMHGAERRA